MLGRKRALPRLCARAGSGAGLSADALTSLIFVFVRAYVHYALFEGEDYLQAQLGVPKRGIGLFVARGAVLEDNAAAGATA